MIPFHEIVLDKDIINKISKYSRYVICFTLRSGSTMLCSTLTKTGKLGVPDEYFNPRGFFEDQYKQLKCQNFNDYIYSIFDKFSTDNYVFGFKIPFNDFGPMLKSSARQIVYGAKFIYLLRRDIISQAVSAFLASKTGSFHAGNDEMRKKINAEKNSVVYDKGGIDYFVGTICEHMSKWEATFQQYSINPLRIFYEDILEDKKNELERIANYLDIKLDCHDFAPATKRLFNDINNAFSLNYKNEFSLCAIDHPHGARPEAG